MPFFPRPLVLALAALLPAATGTLADPRAVVELFTSPNCSSCPPADQLFVELAREPDLITLVMPVDDWSRSKRSDRLSLRAFSERQAAYADVRNEEMLYTPQAMINGAAQADGADPGEIGDAVAQTAGTLSVAVMAEVVGREIVVSVGRASYGAPPAMITVLPFVTSRTVRVYGERVTYANLVRDIVPVGRWSGESVRRAIPMRDYARYDGIVVLLQAGSPERPGAILGAARLSMRAGT